MVSRAHIALGALAAGLMCVAAGAATGKDKALTSELLVLMQLIGLFVLALAIVLLRRKARQLQTYTTQQTVIFSRRPTLFVFCAIIFAAAPIPALILSAFLPGSLTILGDYLLLSSLVWLIALILFTTYLYATLSFFVANEYGLTWQRPFGKSAQPWGQIQRIYPSKDVSGFTKLASSVGQSHWKALVVDEMIIPLRIWLMSDDPKPLLRAIRQRATHAQWDWHTSSHSLTNGRGAILRISRRRYPR